MDKVVEKLVALGVPGLVLLVAISTTGLAGGAAIVAALACLGGPFGMMGGIAVLGILTLIVDALGEYGIEALFKEVLKGLQRKGLSPHDIRQTIASYPITQSLKTTLLEYLDTIRV